MKIVRRVYSRWDEQTKKLLKRASFPRGFLRKYMVAVPDSLTFVAFEGNRVAGWIFVAKIPEGNHANVFINPRYRNRGLARELVRRTLAVYPDIILAEWDAVTKHLFRKLQRQCPGKITIINWWENLTRYQAVVKSLSHKARNCVLTTMNGKNTLNKEAWKGRINVS